jgi:hypothetical protein
MFSRKDNGHFYYSHYYAMQAMVQAGEEHYAKWYPKIRDTLHRAAAAQRLMAGKGARLSAQDADVDYHPRNSEPVYSGLSTLKKKSDVR